MLNVATNGPTIANATPALEGRQHRAWFAARSGRSGASRAVVGGCGRAVIRTYIIGHIGVRPLAVVSAEIAINQICQSNQKENWHFK